MPYRSLDVGGGVSDSTAASGFVVLPLVARLILLILAVPLAVPAAEERDDVVAVRRRDMRLAAAET